MTRDIAFLVSAQFQLLDLSGPMAVFQVANRLLAPAEPYRLHVVSCGGGPMVCSAGAEILTVAVGKESFDTLLVVGNSELPKLPAMATELADTVKTLAPHVRRLGSVCTGAFVLAAAGLLNGHHATTHWRHAALLQRLFPRINVDGDRIFTKENNIWTSAGITAGIDLALAMLEEDHDRETSLAVARDLVVYHRRPGGQTQFSTLLQLEPESDRIRDALQYAREHLQEKLTVEQLAEVACLSPRQFARAFQMETGETPAKAVERMRVETARQRIEFGVEPIEVIAQGVGFKDPERMRRAFIRLFGQPPQGIRRAARVSEL